MKTFFLLILVLMNGIVYSQYSSYYLNSNSNVNVNANINKNVTGSIFQYSTQTIRTIDYGALALANAQKEQNQMEQQKIADETQKRILSEIIADPIKAYDYGQWQGFNSGDKKMLDKTVIKQYEQMTGLKSFGYHYVFPAYFFTQLHWTNWQNVSKDGVITEIFLTLPRYNKENVKFDFEENFEKDTINVAGKEINSFDDTGKSIKLFCHKKELNLATVFSGKGYKYTFVWEDKYQNGITDNYNVFYNNQSVVGNGVVIDVKVRYYGDKDEVSFEQLEGRRYYLKGLIEKIIANAKVQDIVLLKNNK